MTALVLDMGRSRQLRPAREERNTTMIKLNQSGSANVNVLGEDQLGQVQGGHGRCGGYRKYNHRYEDRRYNDCYSYEGGYEGKGHCDSYNDDDYCEEKYNK